MKNFWFYLVLALALGGLTGALGSCTNKQTPFSKQDTVEALFIVAPYGGGNMQPVQRTITGSYRVDNVDTSGDKLTAKREWHIDTAYQIFVNDTVRGNNGQPLIDSVTNKVKMRITLHSLPAAYFWVVPIKSH